MPMLKRGIYVALMLGATGAGLVLAQGALGLRPAGAAPGPSQVVVINGASQPVPVTGAGQTIVTEQTVTIPFLGTTIGPFDVSAYGKLRVYYSTESVGFFQCT